MARRPLSPQLKCVKVRRGIDFLLVPPIFAIVHSFIIHVFSRIETTTTLLPLATGRCRWAAFSSSCPCLWLCAANTHQGVPRCVRLPVCVLSPVARVCVCVCVRERERDCVCVCELPTCNEKLRPSSCVSNCVGKVVCVVTVVFLAMLLALYDDGASPTFNVCSCINHD